MLIVNYEKALVITQNTIRAWRETEFAKNDVKIQNALVDEDKTALKEAKKQRDYLRDLPQQCEGKSVEELKKFLLDLGVISE